MYTAPVLELWPPGLPVSGDLTLAMYCAYILDAEDHIAKRHDFEAADDAAGPATHVGAPTSLRLPLGQQDRAGRDEDQPASDRTLGRLTAESAAPIREGDLLLLDVWGKKKTPGSVYYDITWVGYLGAKVPKKYAKVFGIVGELFVILSACEAWCAV